MLLQAILKSRASSLFAGTRALVVVSPISGDLPGTSPKLHLIERQGDIGATRLLNLLLPELDASIVIVANTEKTDLFNTYSKQGFGYALVKAATGR